MCMVCIWLCVVYCTKTEALLDQDKKMYKEGFGIVILATASNDVPVFNIEQSGAKGSIGILKKPSEKRSLQ